MELPKKIRWAILFSVIILLFAALIIQIYSSWKSGKDISISELNSLDLPEENFKWGFNLNEFYSFENRINNNEFLADILARHNVDYATITEIANTAKKIFDVRKLQAGKKYTILTRDTSATADYFIYEPNPFEYVVYAIKEKSARLVEKEVDIVPRIVAGRIKTSLWQAMADQELDWALASRMEDALEWTVDFHHIQYGDAFKLSYDELWVEGERAGVGTLHAAYFTTSSNDYYAIRYKNDRYDGFYDLEGRPMKKVFLKSPVQYSRISSGYNPRRFHPILKRVRPHLGTDYVAPYGTPIRAVSNGVIDVAGYTKGNGNYIKIKHDKVYTTQYLHMQKFARGIRKGAQVKQGQVIGYVGSTGLATGPHVCFRFWKNGRQVNHLRENLPEPEPMPKEDLPYYFVVRDSLKLVLDGMLIEDSNTESDSPVELAP